MHLPFKPACLAPYRRKFFQIRRDLHAAHRTGAPRPNAHGRAEAQALHAPDRRYARCAAAATRPAADISAELQQELNKARQCAVAQDSPVPIAKQPCLPALATLTRALTHCRPAADASRPCWRATSRRRGTWRWSWTTSGSACWNRQRGSLRQPTRRLLHSSLCCRCARRLVPRCTTNYSRCAASDVCAALDCCTAPPLCCALRMGLAASGFRGKPPARRSRQPADTNHHNQHHRRLAPTRHKRLCLLLAAKSLLLETSASCRKPAAKTSALPPRRAC